MPLVKTLISIEIIVNMKLYKLIKLKLLFNYGIIKAVNRNGGEFMKKIVLAGGCFWGVQEYFSRINGILKTEVGYANGKTYNATYEQVCNDNTGFAEVCYVEYDERIITLKDVLSKFWAVVNPTSLNRQGNDVGNQYRSGIYYFDEDDIADIQESIKELQKKYEKKIVTEVKPLENYFKAEEYHQDYLKKNPNGYCHINLG